MRTSCLLYVLPKFPPAFGKNFAHVRPETDRVTGAPPTGQHAQARQDACAQTFGIRLLVVLLLVEPHGMLSSG